MRSRNSWAPSRCPRCDRRGHRLRKPVRRGHSCRSADAAGSLSASRCRPDLRALDRRRQERHRKLEELGYKVDLQYANDDIPNQQQQIESMLNKGAKALIIASIDGTALTSSCQGRKDGVKVIAYDRLINGSPNVDYYVTFDNDKVGVQQGTSLLTGLGLVDASGKKVEGRARSTSNCSPAARTTTTPSSSSTAPWTC